MPGLGPIVATTDVCALDPHGRCRSLARLFPQRWLVCRNVHLFEGDALVVQGSLRIRAIRASWHVEEHNVGGSNLLINTCNGALASQFRTKEKRTGLKRAFAQTSVRYIYLRGSSRRGARMSRRLLHRLDMFFFETTTSKNVGKLHTPCARALMHLCLSTCPDLLQDG